MLANLTGILKHTAKERPALALGQGALFDAPPIEDLRLVELPEFDQDELLWRERLALGTFVSGHPLDKYRAKLAGKVTHQCRESFDILRSGRDTRCVVAGLIRSYRRLPRIAYLTLEDGTGTLDIVAFNDEAERFAYVLAEDAVVALRIRPRFNAERTSLQLINAHLLGRLRAPK